jgi:hypothetical protein
VFWDTARVKGLKDRIVCKGKRAQKHIYLRDRQVSGMVTIATWILLAGAKSGIDAEEGLALHLQGQPAAPIADKNGRNPHYDRQMFGTDLPKHPWLPDCSPGSHGSPHELISTLATGIDTNKDHKLDESEIKIHMNKVAKLRMINAIKKMDENAVQNAKAHLRHFDADRDFLFSLAETKKVVGDTKKPTKLWFDFSEVYVDGKLSEDEFILFSHKHRVDDSWQREHPQMAVHRLTGEAAKAIIQICDSDNDDMLSTQEMMDHFTHFVTPGGRGVGSRSTHMHKEL